MRSPDAQTPPDVYVRPEVSVRGGVCLHVGAGRNTLLVAVALNSAASTCCISQTALLRDAFKTWQLLSTRRKHTTQAEPTRHFGPEPGLSGSHSVSVGPVCLSYQLFIQVFTLRLRLPLAPESLGKSPLSPVS